MIRALQSFAALFIAPLIALGATLHVDPVTFSLGPAETSATLRLTNADEASVRIQVTAVQWQPGATGETESPTDALVLNPPVFKIEPHQTQFIRFGPRRRGADEREQSFRLLIEEVPDPQAPLVSGLRTVLRISVPVFVKAREPLEHLTWSTQKGATELVVVNDGNTHLRLLRLSTAAPSQAPVTIESVPFYLLPGERRVWKLPSNTALETPLKLSIQSEYGDREESVGPAADLP